VIIHFAIDPKFARKIQLIKIIIRDKKSTTRKVSSFFPIFFKLIPWSYFFHFITCVFIFLNFLSFISETDYFSKGEKELKKLLFDLNCFNSCEESCQFFGRLNSAKNRSYVT